MNYADLPLSELAINIPMSTELFRRHRLDFCCGGKQTLREACEKKSINLELILKELSLISDPVIVDEQRTLPELVSHIINRYHEDLRRRIPELIQLSAKVERVHGDHTSCPAGLTDFLTNFQNEMFLHMMKEENVLFPLISSGRGNLAQMPIKVMGMEHDSHGRQLDELHRLTNDFIPPAEACATWRALYRGLAELEKELMDHIHLENNILFPRALAGNE